MKKLHLVCGAHLDPVWLWDWQEGVATALSTFRVAADFCDEYDGYVFCHNEALLYQWVEEYEPDLFLRIQKLVQEKKWHIMGGWYIQPDCIHLSGESFIRQIRRGRKYFLEKFNSAPTTAVNFDPFGHSRGLVQILKKCGYDSYLFMRPDDMTPGPFIWKGYDSSEIIGFKLFGAYSNPFGDAHKKINEFLETHNDFENALLVWGVGNHGGGASRVDLKNIDEIMKREKNETEIVHSTPEDYFSSLKKDGLRVVDKSLKHSMRGCYTTMVRIKNEHRTLEGLLTRAEKMLVHSGVAYDEALLQKAEDALLLNEFHDILPGTMIKKAEGDALHSFGFAREIVEHLSAKAFFALSSGQKKARDGEIPIMVYNPHPYPIETDVEVEFQPANQNRSMDEITVTTVFDEKGNVIPSQNIKEASTINIDWRKKVVFRAELAPMSMNRFDARLEVLKGFDRTKCFALTIDKHDETDDEILFSNPRVDFAISKKTGLIKRYIVDGVPMLENNACRIGVFADNSDPWGMLTDNYNKNIGYFELLDDSKTGEFLGFTTENLHNVRVIENGAIRMVVEAVFSYKESFAVVKYTLSKGDAFVDVDVDFYTSTVDCMFKLILPTPFENGRFLAQSAFGVEENEKNGKEDTYQKWCGIVEDKIGLCALSKGSGGVDARGGEIRLSLLRTPMYSNHPIDDVPLAPVDRFGDRIDLGERHISIRLLPYGDDVDFRAEQYIEPLYTLSFFPSGNGEKPSDIISISDRRVLLSTMRREREGIVFRLYHAGEGEIQTDVNVFGRIYKIAFSTYEVKTFIYKDNDINECSMI